MTAKCKFCNDTKQEPGVPGVCVWCEAPKASAVRRYTAVELRFATNSTGDYVSAADYDALAENLAERHQGKPVAVPAEKELVRAWGHDMGGNYDEGKAFGWNACLDEIAKLGRLYTRADPGEVERLRIELSEQREIFCMQEDKIDTLRAQVAERDALLSQAKGMLKISAERLPRKHQTIRAHINHFLDGIEAKLSASAEPSIPVERDERAELNDKCAHSYANKVGCPECGETFYGGKPSSPIASAETSAPVEHDERAEFEAHLKRKGCEWMTQRLVHEISIYTHGSSQLLWEGWQARAALEHKP